jgi:two-component system, sensor histidine kinase
MLLDSPEGWLAAAGHDLRQPVQALGLLVASLEERLQDRGERALVQDIAGLVQALDRSLDALLDLSRIEGRGIECRARPVALSDLFHRLDRQFAGQAERRGLALRFRPGGKSVVCDPQLLERIVGNLLQNALKYTVRGGVVVVARSTTSHVHVEVWDTGPGIPVESLPRIFEPFFRIGADVPGSGLGLAIVQRLCESLGLSLRAASRPGRGSVIRVGIPVSHA